MGRGLRERLEEAEAVAAGEAGEADLDRRPTPEARPVRHPLRSTRPCGDPEGLVVLDQVAEALARSLRRRDRHSTG